MKTKTIPWDDATLDELKKFAAQQLGMSPNFNVGETALRGKIRQAWDKDTITIFLIEDEGDETVSDAPVQPPLAPNDGKALRGTAAANDPKVLITIAEVEGPGGKRPVFVGVNGVGMLIPRGKPQPVPYRYYLALQNTVKTTYEQDTDTQEVIASNVMAYPMSVNLMPPQADIDAYLAAEQRPG